MYSLILIVFVNFIGIGALIPVLPFTVIEELGQSETVMTALLASFSLAMFISNPILGRASDYLGRKPVLVVSLFVNMLAHIWFAVSTDILSLFAARILAGLAAGNIGVIQAVITDNTAPENRAKSMGMLGAAIGAGFVLGPALGGLLSGVGDGPVHQVPFLVAASFAFLAFCLALRLQPASPRNSEASSGSASALSPAILMRRPVMLFAAAFFCLNLSFSQVEATHVLLLKDALGFGARQTGWVFVYIGVCIIIVQGGLIGRLVRRFGEMAVLSAGVILLCSGQIVTSVMTLPDLIMALLTLPTVIGLTTAICVGFALTNPSLSAASSHIAGEDERGGVLGVVQGCGSLGQVLGLLLAGPFYQLGGASLSFGFGAVFSFSLLVLVLMIQRGGHGHKVAVSSGASHP